MCRCVKGKLCLPNLRERKKKIQPLGRRLKRRIESTKLPKSMHVLNEEKEQNVKLDCNKIGRYETTSSLALSEQNNIVRLNTRYKSNWL